MMIEDSFAMANVPLSMR